MRTDTISTIAIALGSFLLGGSLGLALSDCDICKKGNVVNIDDEDSLIAINDDVYDDEDIVEEYKEKTSVYITETVGGDTDGDDIDSYLPYVVSRDSYENEHLDFHKESLVYFEKDRILVDDKDEVIDNVEMTVGLEALESFGEGSEDEDIVYVRNIRIRCDFEVVREHMSYKENVLGIKDTEEYLEARRFFNLEE